MIITTRPTMATLNSLKSIFYNSFRLDSPAEMEDFQAMWEAVMARHNVPQPDTWEQFLNDINCMASNDYAYFSNIFNQHFKK